MEFSWKRIGKIIGIIVLLALVVAGVYVFANWRPVKIAWAGLIYDRRENFVDCEHLPFYPQVQKAFSAHPDVVAKVKAVPGITDFYIEKDSCYILTGGTQFIKGQAVLTYQNRAARQQAEKIIGQNFFGIPYRGMPVKERGIEL